MSDGYTTAEMVLKKCLEYNNHIPMPNEPREHTIERIYRGLVGISQCIEGVMPISSRKSREGFFIIYYDLDRLVGVWNESDRIKCRIDMEEAVRDEVMRHMELSVITELCDNIIKIVIRLIVNNDLVPFGFRRTSFNPGLPLLLKWVPPVAS